MENSLSSFSVFDNLYIFVSLVKDWVWPFGTAVVSAAMTWLSMSFGVVASVLAVTERILMYKHQLEEQCFVDAFCTLGFIMIMFALSGTFTMIVLMYKEHGFDMTPIVVLMSRMYNTMHLSVLCILLAIFFPAAVPSLVVIFGLFKSADRIHQAKLSGNCLGVGEFRRILISGKPEEVIVLPNNKYVKFVGTYPSRLNEMATGSPVLDDVEPESACHIVDNGGRFVGNAVLGAYMGKVFLLTAWHNLHADIIILKKKDKEFPFEAKRFFRYNDLAFCSFEGTNPVIMARLGLRAVKMSPINLIGSIVVRAYNGVKWVTSPGFVGPRHKPTTEDPGVKAEYLHTASTSNGHSGAGMYQNGKLVGIHSGSVEPVNIFTTLWILVNQDPMFARAKKIGMLARFVGESDISVESEMENYELEVEDDMRRHLAGAVDENYMRKYPELERYRDFSVDRELSNDYYSEAADLEYQGYGPGSNEQKQLIASFYSKWNSKSGPTSYESIVYESFDREEEVVVKAAAPVKDEQSELLNEMRRERLQQQRQFQDLMVKMTNQMQESILQKVVDSSVKPESRLWSPQSKKAPQSILPVQLENGQQEESQKPLSNRAFKKQQWQLKKKSSTASTLQSPHNLPQGNPFDSIKSESSPVVQILPPLGKHRVLESSASDIQQTKKLIRPSSMGVIYAQPSLI